MGTVMGTVMGNVMGMSVCVFVNWTRLKLHLNCQVHS